MSNLSKDRDAQRCENAPSPEAIEELNTRNTEMGGGLLIRRALPHRRRRLVGAWCFLDHFGPLSLEDRDGMRVGPHPHIGLQTVTWLLEGEIYHRDSLGYEQLIKPGQLNLMTAGRGIAHSEETPPEHGVSLHGLQFWLALPDTHRHIEPAFEHLAELPRFRHDDMEIQLFVGELLGHRSPAKVYSPLVGIDVQVNGQGKHNLPLNPDFEHALMVVEGELHGDGLAMQQEAFYYLGPGRTELTLAHDRPARLILLGGEPLREQVLLWWNFVARNEAELHRAREDWMETDHFGIVHGYEGPRLEAPPLSYGVK